MEKEINKFEIDELEFHIDKSLKESAILDYKLFILDVLTQKLELCSNLEELALVRNIKNKLMEYQQDEN